MTHISSIGAGIFSSMAVAMPAAPPTFATLDSQAEFEALFDALIQSSGGTKAAGTFVQIKDVREFPELGTPPNIVNVPVYGQKSSQQIQGQSDAPNIELTLNYVPAEWASGTLLGDAVGDGNRYVFRFALCNSEPDGYTSDPAGLGSVENTVWFWIGKIEALSISPQLTDANTATVTMSIQSAFFGAYTTAAV